MPLTLGRTTGDKLVIGEGDDAVVIVFKALLRHKVVIEIYAPPRIKILRGELIGHERLDPGQRKDVVREETAKQRGRRATN